MGTDRAQRYLWRLYARCYDGLLDLVPYRRLLDLAADRVELHRGQSLTDLGCGTGNALSLLAEAVPGATLTGVDSSPSMLAVARRKLASRPSVRFVESDLLDWLEQAPSASIDRILSVNVLYTMQAAERERFWRHAMRALSPEGRLVVITTDRAGIGPVIREQTEHRSFLRSVTPRLAAVLLLNMVIWLFESRKVFDPASAETLSEECERAGGAVLSVERCYGGEVDGVDILLVVEPVIDLSVDEERDEAPGVDAGRDVVADVSDAALDEGQSSSTASSPVSQTEG